MSKKNALGKGLGAIFPDLMEDPANKPHFAMCGIEELSPNRFQPRRIFDEKEQKKLADSIRENGVLQPILVRKPDDQPGYEIIAGERRWRAAQAAGLQDVPIIIRQSTGDRDVAELSLIENIQREELNPIEESEAYHTLIDRFHLSQEEVSSRVGKERSTIANALRLLHLPDEAKNALVRKEISAGHARAILSVPSHEGRISILKEIVRKKLSVREAEKLAQRLASAKAKHDHGQARKEPYITDIESKMSKYLMAITKIKPLRKGGVIEIRFLSDNDLDRVYEVIMSGNDR